MSDTIAMGGYARLCMETLSKYLGMIEAEGFIMRIMADMMYHLIV